MSVDVIGTSKLIIKKQETQAKHTEADSTNKLAPCMCASSTQQLLTICHFIADFIVDCGTPSREYCDPIYHHITPHLKNLNGGA